MSLIKRIPAKYLIIAGISVTILAVLYFASKPAPVRYDLQTGSGEPDFKTAVYHSADDGIAVIGQLETTDASDLYIAPMANAVSLTSDPDRIWEPLLGEKSAAGGNESTTSAPASPVGGYTPAEEIIGPQNRLGAFSIPSLAVDAEVYESGDNIQDMSHGIAHFPHSSVWDGNVCLSAHNVNFDGSRGYFYSLHTLKAGDEIVYKTSAGERTYTVSAVTEISEMDWSSLTRTQDNRLTMITCITGKPDKRLCVQALEAIK